MSNKAMVLADQFMHAAAHMAWCCSVNAPFSPLLMLRGGKFKVDFHRAGSCARGPE